MGRAKVGRVQGQEQVQQAGGRAGRGPRIGRGRVYVDEV